MTDVSVKIEDSVDNDGLRALQLKEEIIVFYKLGFLDAYKMCNNIKIYGSNKNGASKEARLFQRISDKCKICFEKRFARNVEKQIKKVKREN